MSQMLAPTDSVINLSVNPLHEGLCDTKHGPPWPSFIMPLNKFDGKKVSAGLTGLATPRQIRPGLNCQASVSVTRPSRPQHD